MEVKETSTAWKNKYYYDFIVQNERPGFDELIKMEAFLRVHIGAKK